MIYIFSFVEKVLKEVSVELDNKENVHIIILQRYISWLGPWFPSSPKIAKVFDKYGQEIPIGEWTAALKNEVKRVKSTVPLQLSFFRNSIIFTVVFAVLLVVMPRINQQKAASKQLTEIELNNKIQNIQVGDVFRVIFYNDSSGNSINGIGLIKITRVKGDSVYLVRSREMIENTLSNKQKTISLMDFVTQEEVTDKKVIVQSGRDRSVVSIRKEGEASGFLIATIVALQN